MENEEAGTCSLLWTRFPAPLLKRSRKFSIGESQALKFIGSRPYIEGEAFSHFVPLIRTPREV